LTGVNFFTPKLVTRQNLKMLQGDRSEKVKIVTCKPFGSICI